MNSYLGAVLWSAFIWLVGYLGQRFALTRYPAPKWLVRLCLVKREDDRLAPGATAFQLLAYELLLLLLFILTFVPADWAWTGVAISLAIVACMVGNFLLLRSLLGRA